MSLLCQIGSNPFDSSKLEESKTYQRKHIDLESADPEPYYWVGVIDWALAYRANQKLRSAYNDTARSSVRDDVPLPDPLREQFSREYGAAVDEGIENLKKAIKLRPDYDDALAYLNLLYRQKADQFSTRSEREEYLQMADDLIDKVKETKVKKMCAQGSGAQRPQACPESPPH